MPKSWRNGRVPRLPWWAQQACREKENWLQRQSQEKAETTDEEEAEKAPVIIRL